MTVPKNVLWFEVLLYLSLMLDALSVAFQDRTPSADVTESTITAATVIAACLILLLVYFVWLAAQRRKNWPRWVLVAALVLSVISLAADHRRQRRGTRQRHRDRVLRADRGRAVFLLYRRRAGLVQRVRFASVRGVPLGANPDAQSQLASGSGFAATHAPRNDGRLLRSSTESW